ILTLYSSPSLLHTTTTPPISPLSLHDALPIYMQFLTPKIFGNNASFRIQQEVRRYPLNSIFLHHIRLPPFELRNMWPILQSIVRSEEHTSELQSRENLVCRLLLEKKKAKEQYL